MELNHLDKYPHFKQIVKDVINKSHLQKKLDKPKLVYTHTGPSHSYDTYKPGCAEDEVARYEWRLGFANVEMNTALDYINKNDPQALVIIMSDHGPYLIGDCSYLEDYEESSISRGLIEDRFSTFLAIRWPEYLRKKEDPEIKLPLSSMLYV